MGSPTHLEHVGLERGSMWGQKRKLKACPPSGGYSSLFFLCEPGYACWALSTHFHLLPLLSPVSSWTIERKAIFPDSLLARVLHANPILPISETCVRFKQQE